MITINILLGVLVLLLGYRYYELCEDIQKIREDIDRLEKLRYNGHAELKDDIYRLEKEPSRDGIEKLQGDVEKLQKELEEVDVRRYSGDSQLKEWLKAITSKINNLSYD
jgi:predicted nuclease with TOPRIM domain